MYHKCESCKVVGPGPAAYINMYGAVIYRDRGPVEICRQCGGEIKPVSQPAVDVLVAEGYQLVAEYMADSITNPFSKWFQPDK